MAIRAYELRALGNEGEVAGVALVCTETQWALPLRTTVFENALDAETYLAWCEHKGEDPKRHGPAGLLESVYRFFEAVTPKEVG